MSLFTKAALSSLAFRKLGIAVYFAGGQSTSTASSVADKIETASRTRSTLSSGLSVARSYGSGFANFRVAGYHAGGTTASMNVDYSDVDKWAFPGDTRSTLGTGLPGALASHVGCQDEAVAGYVIGGINSRRLTKFAFPTDTQSSTSLALATIRDYAQGMSDTAVACFVAGGSTSSTSIEKFAFPSDSRSTLAATLSTGASTGAGMSNAGVAGYVVLGTSNCRKLSFVNGTTSTSAAALSTALTSISGASESGGWGYVGGGLSGGVSATSSSSEYNFNSETRSSGSGLSTSRYGVAGFGNTP